MSIMCRTQVDYDLNTCSEIMSTMSRTHVEYVPNTRRPHVDHKSNERRTHVDHELNIRHVHTDSVPTAEPCQRRVGCRLRADHVPSLCANTLIAFRRSVASNSAGGIISASTTSSKWPPSSLFRSSIRFCPNKVQHHR